MIEYDYISIWIKIDEYLIFWRFFVIFSYVDINFYIAQLCLRYSGERLHYSR